LAVYVDDAIWAWRGRQWCHLLADDVDELHRFAARLGLHRTSYQGPPKTSCPHYDLTAYERRRALRHGAIACDRAAIVAVFRQVRTGPCRSSRQERPAAEHDAVDAVGERTGIYSTRRDS
jgi:hypothetical protein